MIQIHSCPMDITGRIAEIGDPLSQVAVYPLVTHLLESLELRVCVHVSNRTDISLLDPRANIILIPFSPSTRHQDDNYWANLNYLSEDGEILFIVNSDEDYDWMIAVVDKFNLNTRFTVNMTTGKHRMPQNKWAKKLIKDAAPVHYLVPTPFTAIPLKIDKPEQSKY